MPGQTQTNDAIRIDAQRDADRPVLLCPENNDLFVRTAKQVIADSQLSISVEVWISELDSLRKHVEAWIAARPAGQVRSCFITPRKGRVILFFIPASDQYDFDLGDALAALSQELVRTYNIGPVQIQQIPYEEIDRFLDTSTSLQIYGRPQQPHQTVEA